MLKKGCLGIIIIFVGLMVLGGIIAAVSGDSDSGSNSSSSSTSAPVKKDGLTYEKFVSVQMGSSYEDVVAIIGEEGKLGTSNTIGDIETKMYEWNDGGANMNAMFQNGKLVNKAMASLSQLVKPNGDNIKMEQFDKVQNGMSYEEVKAIFGRDGFIMSEGSMMGITTQMYCWINTGGANAEVTFQNGGVQMKAQVGLK